MPLFHFNSRTGDAILPDPEGEEQRLVRSRLQQPERRCSKQ
jgi:hypothetical protein